MGFGDLTNKIKKAANDYKENQAVKKANEEARQQAILSGNIEPVQVVVNLEPNEKAYAEFSSKRMAIIDSIVEKTVGKSKKKGVVTRAVVGGVLLGPLGAVGGAATAGSKSNSTTTQETVSKLQQVDKGSLIFTNKRMMFIGTDVVSLPYNRLIAVSFGSTLTGKKLTVKYEGMLKDEHYILSGDKAKDTELYYRGITEKLLLKETTDNNQNDTNSIR